MAHGHPIDSVTLRLIRDGKEGDKSALNTLFARYQERVLRIVRLRLNQELRERLRLQSMDVLQDVFLHALRRLSTFEPTSEGSFLHWLSKIAENTIRDHLDYAGAGKRDRSAERSLDQSLLVSREHVHLRDLIPDGGMSPTQHMLRHTIKSTVEDLLLELDDDERELIIQRKMEELTFAEMAAMTGATEDAVRKRFNRSFQKLVNLAESRGVMQELGPG